MSGRILSLLLALSLLPGCADFSGKQVRTVTIRVIAVSEPGNSRLFLAGSGNELGNWKPDGIPLKRLSDSSWSATLVLRTGTDVSFKVTRGNWNTEALDSRDPQTGALQHFTVTADTSIFLSISKWMDRDAGVTTLKATMLSGEGFYDIPNAWRYHPGDNSQWASMDFSDSSWARVNSRLEAGNEPPGGWGGIGWFRLDLEVDTSLWNIPIAYGISQGGASEIYLDGRKINTFGRVGHSARSERIFFADKVPGIIWFTPQSRHVLAVRYSNFDRSPLRRDFFFPGFDIVLGNWTPTQSAVFSNLVREIAFTTILAVLAFIHFLLFLFNPKLRENLFYTISTLGGLGVWVANSQWAYSVSERYIGMLDAVAQVCAAISIISGIFLVYSLGTGKFPRRIGLYAVIGIIVAIWGALEWSSLYQFIQNAYVVVMLLEMVWGTIRASRNQLVGGVVLSAGFSVLAMTVIYNTLGGYGLLPESFPALSNSFVYGFVALGIAMSVFLSRRFARTRRELEIKLDEVKRLSEQTLEQERQVRESEIQRRLLAADNERKTSELEEARALQLSMLPQNVPSVPNLDIAVRMETATEVGGDYYDFFLSDGVLTAAVGDATGHGLKAGNMVIATKGLFNVLSSDAPLDEFLEKSNRAIKKMNFHMLTMCLSVARLSGSKIEYTSAGMPPMLIYRRNFRTIEEVVLKAMPLGAFVDFPYTATEIVCYPGDVIFLASDGLSELFNDRQELFGSTRVKEALKESADKTAAEIVGTVFERAGEWREGSQLNDDLTVLVVKFRE